MNPQDVLVVVSPFMGGFIMLTASKVSIRNSSKPCQQDKKQKKIFLVGHTKQPIEKSCRQQVRLKTLRLQKIFFLTFFKSQAHLLQESLSFFLHSFYSPSPFVLYQFSSTRLIFGVQTFSVSLCIFTRLCGFPFHDVGTLILFER